MIKQLKMKNYIPVTISCVFLVIEVPLDRRSVHPYVPVSAMVTLEMVREAVPVLKTRIGFSNLAGQEFLIANIHPCNISSSAIVCSAPLEL